MARRKRYSKILTPEQRKKLVEKYGRFWRKNMANRKDHTSTSWGYITNEKVSTHKPHKYGFQKVKTAVIQKKLPPTIDKQKLENLKRLLEEDY